MIEVVGESRMPTQGELEPPEIRACNRRHFIKWMLQFAGLFFVGAVVSFLLLLFVPAKFDPITWCAPAILLGFAILSLVMLGIGLVFD